MTVNSIEQPIAAPQESPVLFSAALDPALLQELQDAFSSMAGVSIGICDARGAAITAPSCNGPFCGLMATMDSSRAACALSIESLAHKSLSCGPHESTDCSSSTCHAGMRQTSLPIEVQGERIGAIIVGERPVGPLNPANLNDVADRHGLPLDVLTDAAEALPPWSQQRRDETLRLARLLAEVIATIYQQERVIRHRMDELAAVGDLASMLSGTANLKIVLDRTARRVAEVMRVKACAIRLLDESTGELVMSAVHNLSEGYLAKGPVLLRDNPVDKAAFDGQVVYIEDAGSDPRLRYPEQAQQEGIVSGLCVGMAYRGHYVGVLRVYTGKRKAFSKFEESLLKSIAAQAAAAIVNTRLFSQQREAERYHRQMEYAREIQGRMIPVKAPRHRYIDFAGIYAPTLSVGGDFYDFFDLPWGNVGVCIADVVGKGIPAALMMASVRSVLRGHADSILDINDIITRVNRHMCRDTLIGEFCTLFYGVFSPDGGQLTYCNAGHDPPLLLREGAFRSLNVGGMVVGVQRESTYEKEVVELQSGDVLICYTDGVVDASDFEGTRYGLDRFRASILRHAEEPAGTLADQLKWDVRRFAGLAPQADDISIVVAKVR